jgi:hypothetical protein
MTKEPVHNYTEASLLSQHCVTNYWSFWRLSVSDCTHYINKAIFCPSKNYNSHISKDVLNKLQELTTHVNMLSSRNFLGCDAVHYCGRIRFRGTLLPPSSLHRVKTQKISTCIFTALKTSNLDYLRTHSIHCKGKGKGKGEDKVVPVLN